MKYLLIAMLFVGCTLEVPVDEVEIPPVENSTTIVVSFPDGLSFSVPIGGEETGDDSEDDCEFQQLPDYQNYGGIITYCTGIVDRIEGDKTCCFFHFPESSQICEEEWCIAPNNNCGWELISWDCHIY